MTDRVAYPRHPAHLDPYIEVLGHELAVTFLVMFGGCQMYFPNDPAGRSAAEQLIGRERLKRLGAMMRDNKAEIPMPKPWLIRALHAEGMSNGQICRALKTTSTNVKAVLRMAGEGAPQVPDQLSLF